jgi:endonuclease-3
MNRQERADRIRTWLAEWLPAPGIPLQHSDAFTLLVAVVLSAQCTDERVNLVTPGLFARAHTPAGMAALPVPEILAAIRSCGLAPQKARALQALSQQLVERHGGVVPADPEALERLPGVGHKTASVVLAQAFGQDTFPVDTHIHRLAWRWGLSDGSSVARTERDCKRVFPAASWNALHLQMIWFGRRHCPARGHDPDACPICTWAMAAVRRRTEAAQRRRVE